MKCRCHNGLAVETGTIRRGMSRDRRRGIPFSTNSANDVMSRAWYVIRESISKSILEFLHFNFCKELEAHHTSSSGI